MVPVLVLIPALITLVLLYYKPVPRVLLLVYLPCLMLVPMYLNFGISGLSLDPSALVVATLAVAGLRQQYRNLRLRPLDCCLLLYVFSAWYADAQHGEFNLAMYGTCSVILSIACPYIAGRTIIEQGGIRVEFAKRMVLFLCFVAFVSVWEFRMVSNPFQNLVERLSDARSGWIRQMRWGFARIAGPFGHAISAGEVFTTGLMLQMWLVTTKQWRVSKSDVKVERKYDFGLLEGSSDLTVEPPPKIRPASLPLILTLGILAGLFMTQSRGPWIGCGFGMIIASIGLFKNRKLASAVAVSVLVISFVVTSVSINQYTAPAASATRIHQARIKDMDQQNAVYRRQLLDTYLPLVAQGGLWGWGTPQDAAGGMFTYVKDQPSIDNHYLLIAMSQGYVGLALFVLMLALGVLRLIYRSIRFQLREDITFAFCLLGIVIATSFTLSTVYLGQPMIQILFLVLGWSESLQATPKKSGDLEVNRANAQPYLFDRVYV